MSIYLVFPVNQQLCAIKGSWSYDKFNYGGIPNDTVTRLKPFEYNDDWETIIKTSI